MGRVPTFDEVGKALRLSKKKIGIVAKAIRVYNLVPHSETSEDERILLAAIPDSVALRASIVIGARSRSFRLLVRLVERMRVLALPAWRRYRTMPIDERDVTEMLLASASAPIGSRSLDIGGPDVLSYGEMIERIADLMLVSRPAVGFGVSATPLTARVAAAIAGEDPELVVPLMESLEGDLLPRDDHAAELLGVELHSFDRAVEHALAEWEQTEALAARWRACSDERRHRINVDRAPARGGVEDGHGPAPAARVGHDSPQAAARRRRLPTSRVRDGSADPPARGEPRGSLETRRVRAV